MRHLPARRPPRPTIWFALAILVLPVRPARADVVCTAADLCPAGTDPCTIAGIHSLASGCQLDFASRAVTLTGVIKAASTGDTVQVSAGSLTLSSGKLKSPGTLTSPGGSVVVTVTGSFRMEGDLSRIDTSGGAGAGDVSLTAGQIDLAAGKILAVGGSGADCDDGGDISIFASGTVQVAATVDSSAGGFCSGGSVSITGSQVEVRKPIDTGGGDASLSTLEITATAGDITTFSGGPLRVNGSLVEFQSGGDGGSIALDATGSVTLGDVVEATGAAPDGSAGTVDVSAAGGVSILAAIDAHGFGADSFGGDVTVAAGGPVGIGGSIRADGGLASSGGSVDVEAGSKLTLFAGSSISVDGGAFDAGFIDLTGHRDSFLLGDLRGRGSNGGAGGVISLDICSLDLRSAIDVTAAAPGAPGSIDLRGGSVTLAASAKLLASGCAGPTPCNAIAVRVGAPSIDPAATLDPAPAISVDPAINTCCGNSTIEAWESCDDGNTFFCDGCSPTCTAEPTPPCPPDGNECTQDCHPFRGCIYAPLSNVACTDDGDICTTDACQAGACQHPPLDCDDGVACTVDSCDSTTGCRSTPEDALCDDGTTCTIDTCDASAGCLYQNQPDGTACDDGSLCTTGDECQAGACVGSGPPLDCDDGDACTTDTCQAQLGCVNLEDPVACPCSVGGSPVPAGSACVDGDPCTKGESCDGAGQCVGTVACDDGDPCTTDVCGGAFGCIHQDNACPTDCSGLPDGTPCSDGATCTSATCQAGLCVSAPAACDDGDACNGAEACFEGVGCRQVSYSDPACTAAVGAFTCYAVRPTKGSARFQKRSGVPLTDALGSRPTDVKKPASICLPANLAGSDPDALSRAGRLEDYLARPAKGSPAFAGISSVRVDTAFASVTIDLRKPNRLLVPTALDPNAPPAPLAPPLPRAYECYPARIAKGTSAPPPFANVAVEDAFGPLAIDTKAPRRVCLPADLDGQDPSAPGDSTALFCVRARTAKGTAGFVKQKGLFARNGFGDETIDALRLTEVCVAATASPPAP